MMLKDYMKFSDGRYMQAMFATGGAAILWAAFPNVATILLLIVSGGRGWRELPRDRPIRSAKC